MLELCNTALTVCNVVITVLILLAGVVAAVVLVALYWMYGPAELKQVLHESFDECAGRKRWLHDSHDEDGGRPVQGRDSDHPDA